MNNIPYTPEEYEEHKRIRAKYEGEPIATDGRRKTKEEIINALNEEKGALQAMNNELREWQIRAERRYVAELKGPPALIEELLYQAEYILELSLQLEASRQAWDWIYSHDAETAGKELLSVLKEKEAAMRESIRGKGLYAKEEIIKETKERTIILWEAIQQAGIEKEAEAALEAYLHKSPFVIQSGIDAPQYPLKPKLKISETYGLMNDGLALSLPKKHTREKQIEGQLYFVWDTNQARKGEEPVYASLAIMGDNKEAVLSKSLGTYDISVLNAIISLCHAHEGPGPLIVSTAELERYRSGRYGQKIKVSESQERKIKASIDKMRTTLVKIDIKEEIEKGFVPGIENSERLKSGFIEDNMLTATYGEFTTEKGRVIKAYAIKEMPILGVYNEIKGHTLYFPYKLLQISEEASATGDITIIRDYLLREIKRMTTGKGRNSKRIVLETLYRETEIHPPKSRAEAARERAKIEKILNSWIKIGPQEDFIVTGFEWIKEGNKITKLEIKQGTTKGRKKG